MRVPKASAPTTEVSTKTAARRTKAMSKVREVVSAGDSSRQLQLEVKQLPLEERQQLLRGSGFLSSVPVGEGLAMKCDVGLPWNKLRVLRK